MPLDVISVSRHAQQRYRIQHPDALISDIHFAVKRAIVLDTALSFALAGRAPRVVDPQQEEHRLHVTGCGVFVICALEDEPGRGFVRTYLRLGAQQQRMARSWFLDPLKPIREAFAMGFAAARAPDAPVLPAPAIENNRDALAALSARLIVQPPAPEPLNAPVSWKPPPRVWSTTWSPTAVQQLLTHQRIYSDLEGGLKYWRVLEPASLTALLAYDHIPPITCVAGYIEPRWRAAALIVSAEDVLVVAAVVSVPQPLQETLKPQDAALSGEMAEQTLSADALVVAASEVVVSSWSPRAVREARENGFSHVPVPWLSQLSSVEVDTFRRIAVRLRWTLQSGSTYAARRSREHVLLMRRGPDAPAGTVVRCCRIPSEPF